ncbi:hypothetical protein BJ165DRAFT_1400987 [Panaeolus papilionaceus]|nr:hypothetical protein BJ165DRAFT_1400987 [Panaeolus papilionaceus]
MPSGAVARRMRLALIWATFVSSSMGSTLHTRQTPVPPCLANCMVNSSLAVSGTCGPGQDMDTCKCSTNRSQYIPLVANCFRAQCPPNTLTFAYGIQEDMCNKAGVPVNLRAQGGQPAAPPASAPATPASNKHNSLDAVVSAPMVNIPQTPIPATARPPLGSPSLSSLSTTPSDSAHSSPQVSGSIQSSSSDILAASFTMPTKSALSLFYTSPTTIYPSSSTAQAPAITITSSGDPRVLKGKLPSIVGAIVGGIIGVLGVILYLLLILILCRQNCQHKRRNRVLVSPFLPTPTQDIDPNDTEQALDTPELEPQDASISGATSNDPSEKEKAEEVNSQCGSAVKDSGIQLSSDFTSHAGDQDDAVDFRATRFRHRRDVEHELGLRNSVEMKDADLPPCYTES